LCDLPHVVRGQANAGGLFGGGQRLWPHGPCDRKPDRRAPWRHPRDVCLPEHAARLGADCPRQNPAGTAFARARNARVRNRLCERSRSGLHGQSDCGPQRARPCTGVARAHARGASDRARSTDLRAGDARPAGDTLFPQEFPPRRPRGACDLSSGAFRPRLVSVGPRQAPP
jgi:hypothetical protein